MLNWGSTTVAHAPVSVELEAIPSREHVRDRYRAACKRGIDVTIALTLAIALLPLFAILALLIRWTSPGPAVFRQQRIGHHGRPFTLLKFRTMLSADDTAHRKYIQRWIRDGEEARSQDCFKLSDDPRITAVGRVLRKYSLDELPQLFNVLFGHMSLVGPRPALAYEVAEYKPWQHERLQVRPGLTGLWQVSGRNRLSFERMVKLDVLYVRTWSLAEDFKILLKTSAVVARGTGH